MGYSLTGSNPVHDEKLLSELYNKGNNFAYFRHLINSISYLISSNSFNWSHSHTDQNIKSNSFPFAINDIIDVNLSGNNLTFKKRKNNQSTSLKIKLS